MQLSLNTKSHALAVVNIRCPVNDPYTFPTRCVKGTGDLSTGPPVWRQECHFERRPFLLNRALTQHWPSNAITRNERAEGGQTELCRLGHAFARFTHSFATPKSAVFSRTKHLKVGTASDKAARRAIAKGRLLALGRGVLHLLASSSRGGSTQGRQENEEELKLQARTHFAPSGLLQMKTQSMRRFARWPCLPSRPRSWLEGGKQSWNRSGPGSFVQINFYGKM